MIGIIICPKVMEPWPKETLLCKDNKIHIRLRTYDKPETISGFIDKLTFLVTYIIRPYSSIEEFTSSNVEFQELTYKITKDYTNYSISGCEGIKILPEYSKLRPESKLGYIKDNYMASSSSSLKGLLSAFQESTPYFLNIKEILFNDNISIILSDGPLVNDKGYLKFANKLIRKYNKEEHKVNIVDLWGDKDGNN